MTGGRFSMVAAAWIALLAGCRLPGMDGPVSRSMVHSRQLSQQGVAALERGQTDRADELLASAVKTCPSNYDARRNHAEALWKKGFREQAVTELEAAQRMAPDNAAMLVRLAEMRLALGQINEASRLAQRAVDLEPKSAASVGVRAQVLRAGGNRTQALADYQRALAYSPDDRRIPCEMASLYLELSQPQKALAAIQGLADRYPSGDEPQEVFYYQGLSYLALARYDDAVESLAVAARGRPSPDLLCALAQAHWQAGHAADASATVRQALAIDPQHPSSRQFLQQIQVAQQPDGVQRR